MKRLEMIEKIVIRCDHCGIRITGNYSSIAYTKASKEYPKPIIDLCGECMVKYKKLTDD